MRAENALRARTKGMPDGIRADLDWIDEHTGTAEIRLFISALLDLNDERLVSVSKEIMVGKGALKASDFNAIRKGIEEERRAKALVAQARAQAKAGGCRVDSANFMTQVQYAHGVLKEKNSGPEPIVMAYGNTLVRLPADPHTGTRSIVELERDGLVALLTRHDIWNVGAGDDKVRGVRAPLDVAVHILSDDEGMTEFPRLTGVLTAPAFGPDGKLINQPGLDRATGYFYAPPRGFNVPDLPAKPSDAEVEAARLEIADALGDMPFSGMTRERLERGDPSPDFAHAVAYVLTPLVRPLLGPTARWPALYVGKASYGCGASLLLGALQLITTGQTDLRPALPKRDDEAHKEIIAALASGRSQVAFDNCAHVGGQSLAALITAPFYSGRTLNRSETRSYPNRLDVAFTGANVAFEKEMQRRITMCWLEVPGTESPQDRPASTFKHPDLLAHISARRSVLYYSLCVLVKNWLAKGRPLAEGDPVLASFEPWSRAIYGPPAESAAAAMPPGRTSSTTSSASATRPAGTRPWASSARWSSSGRQCDPNPLSTKPAAGQVAARREAGS